MRQSIIKSRRLLIILIIIGLFVLVFFSLFKDRNASEVFLVFRYDDYSSESSLLIEREILDMLDRYEMSCSFGIIPYSIEPGNSGEKEIFPIKNSKITLIKEYVREGSINIGIHGFLHITTNNTESKTEFAGVPYKEQFDKIRASKNLLDSLFETKIISFIPPWNSYDEHTLNALKTLSFLNVSADNGQGDYNERQFNFIPFTAYFSDIKKILEYRKIPIHNNLSVMVLMIHDYDFREIDSTSGIIDIPEFRKVIDRIVQMGWNIVSIDQAVEMINRFDIGHYKLNRLKLNLLNHFPGYMKNISMFEKFDVLDDFYLSNSQVAKILILLLLYYLLILILIGEVFAFILRKMHINKRFIFPLIFVLCFSIVSLSFYFLYDDHSLGRHECMGLMIIAGAMFSTIDYLSFIRREGRKIV